MAITKDFDRSSLIIEVEAGNTSTVSPIYKKKSFEMVKQETTPKGIYAITEAIKAVLKNQTRDYLITHVSVLTNSEE